MAAPDSTLISQPTIPVVSSLTHLEPNCSVLVWEGSALVLDKCTEAAARTALVTLPIFQWALFYVHYVFFSFCANKLCKYKYRARLVCGGI